VIAERLTRAVKLQLGGAEWPITITHDVLLGLEEETGADVLGGEIDVWRPSASSLLAIVWLALRRTRRQLSRAQAAAWIVPVSVPAIQAAIVEAWAAAMPDPDPTVAGGSPKNLRWAQAYAMARVDLGLTEGEWLSMTPRVVQELFRRRLELMKREESLHGIVPEKSPVPSRNLTGEDIIAAMGGKTYLRG